MSSDLEPVASRSTQLGELLSHLENLQNADGGWGFHSGAQSRVEPTCWAIRALFSARLDFQSIQLRRAANFLRAQQLPDGSWPASSEMKTGSWVTSLVCSVLLDNVESDGQVRAGCNGFAMIFRVTAVRGSVLCEDFGGSRTSARKVMRIAGGAGHRKRAVGSSPLPLR